MVDGFIRTAVSVAFSGVVSLAAFTLPTSAMAAPSGAPHVAVRYADLDLTSEAGARALHTRIDRATSEVCGEADSRDFTGMREIRECRRVAMQDAAAQVDLVLAQARGGQVYAANDTAIRALR
jgi:UrcA family protein